VAVYTGAATLSSDRIRAHYLSGTQQRSLQADRIYALAAAQFQAALDFAPDDQLVLAKCATAADEEPPPPLCPLCASEARGWPC
jgi:hypothetical protein